MRIFGIVLTLILCASMAMPEGDRQPISAALQELLRTVNETEKITAQQYVAFHDRAIAELRRTLNRGACLVIEIDDLRLLTRRLHALASQFHQWLRVHLDQEESQYMEKDYRFTEQLSAALRLNDDQRRRLAEITWPWPSFKRATHFAHRCMHKAVHRTIDDFGISALRLQQQHQEQEEQCASFRSDLATFFDFCSATIESFVEVGMADTLAPQAAPAFEALLTRLAAGEGIESILDDLTNLVYRYN